MGRFELVTVVGRDGGGRGRIGGPVSGDQAGTMGGIARGGRTSPGDACGWGPFHLSTVVDEALAFGVDIGVGRERGVVLLVAPNDGDRPLVDQDGCPGLSVLNVGALRLVGAPPWREREDSESDWVRRRWSELPAASGCTAGSVCLLPSVKSAGNTQTLAASDEIGRASLAASNTSCSL